MRMWMVDPKLMCDKHLLGEHVEIHMFVGHVNLKRRLGKFVENRLIEPDHMQSRHDDLVAEMEARGMNHKSPLRPYTLEHMTPNERHCRVDVAHSLAELASRCDICKMRQDSMGAFPMLSAAGMAGEAEQ